MLVLFSFRPCSGVFIYSFRSEAKARNVWPVGLLPERPPPSRVQQMLVKRKGEITKIFQVSGYNCVAPYGWNGKSTTVQWRPGSWVQSTSVLGPALHSHSGHRGLGLTGCERRMAVCISSHCQGTDRTPQTTLTRHCKATWADTLEYRTPLTC